jgi:hypothetical protein
MTGEIRVYVEGGGDQKETKARLRTAFGAFLKELRNRAGEKRVHWSIITCGGRTSTFDDYRTALKSHPNAVNVLVVDAEAPVSCDSPWEHLKSRPGDQWHNPGVSDEHCHLMVQAMEAWLIADRERLGEYYGQGFHENSLPNNPNVEQIAKDVLAKALKNATRATRKGPYHKTRHAPEILERIRPDEVKKRATFCRRLFDTLGSQIDAM